MRQDSNEERGLIVLAKLRGLGAENEIIRREKDEIIEAIAIESKEEGTWGDLFRGNGIAADKRFYLALGIQFMQQNSCNRCPVSGPTPVIGLVVLISRPQASTLSLTMPRLCFKAVWV